METKKSVKKVRVNTHKLPLAEDATVLKHILSPLELKARDNQYKSFTYIFNKMSITVSLKEAEAILTVSKSKIDVFTKIIHRSKIASQNKVVNIKRQFMESLITAHGLPITLTNKLSKTFSCKNMYDVLRSGKQQLALKRSISKIGLKKLELLINENACSHLF